MVVFFSSIFEANSNVGDGLGPLFVPRGWKLSAGRSLFLGFKLKKVSIIMDIISYLMRNKGPDQTISCKE
jgi:hypothetical protein